MEVCVKVECVCDEGDFVYFRSYFFWFEFYLLGYLEVEKGEDIEGKIS